MAASMIYWSVRHPCPGGGASDYRRSSEVSASAQSRRGPMRLYKGNSRFPDEVFNAGFTAEGPESSIAAQENRTGYISTSATRRVRPKEESNKWKDEPRRGGLYHSDNRPQANLEMVFVSDALNNGLDLTNSGETDDQELAVLRHVPRKTVKGAQRNKVLEDFAGDWGLHLLKPSAVKVEDTNDASASADAEVEEALNVSKQVSRQILARGKLAAFLSSWLRW